MNLTKLLFSGVHEVIRLGKGGGVSQVGYVDNVDVALETFKNDRGYTAIYASLNPLPRLPEGFRLNEFRPAPHRSAKDWYAKRTAIMVDCDPLRINGITKSNSTDVEKAAAWKQLCDVLKFLCDGLRWPRPVVLDSGNGYQARFAVELPADQATEDLIRNLLCGLAAKFDNDQSVVDKGVFDACRVGKLPGTWARKGPEETGRPWRLSQVLEVPEREIELPASPNRSREVVTEPDIEPVPRGLIEAAIGNLPIPQKVAAGLVLPPDAVKKYEWLREFLLQNNVPILKERESSKRLLIDIVCPWEDEHGSTTGDSSTSVWYTRGHGYGFHCYHSACAGANRDWFAFRDKVDPERATAKNLPALPGDATHTEVARYFRDCCPEFHNHVRVYDVERLRATFVATRWDLVDQSNTLLMAALQPVCDRLRWDLPEPDRPDRDYRRVIDSHHFRQGVMLQLIPMLDKVRFGMFDADPYLIGLPGGKVGDLRTGEVLTMERRHLITRRLRINAKDEPTEVYDYFMRSISSANDQPADEKWMKWMERLLGYCLLGSLPSHIWPLWTGEGGNGKSVLARLLSYILGDFCALVRWSELTHDERGADNAQKRLNARLIGSRCAIVEEMGETSGAVRVLEMSAIKNITGNGELVGADVYKKDIRGNSNVKLITLLNRVPFIEPDGAMERRVQIFPFRAVFNDRKYPGCVREAMEKKQAPHILREQPDRIEAMLRTEAPGILFKWMRACRDFIADGEHMRDWPDVIQKATREMFQDANWPERFSGECLAFGSEFDATGEELTNAGEEFHRDNTSPVRFDLGKLTPELQRRHCTKSNHIVRNGKQVRGWKGVKVRE
jgi:phage/plasmid-associated DNA primase